ncbi:Uncharacterised protein [Nocardia otitidiscaviarum]|uniref:Uncharacterized protein n=1 Tax=Nocardia otitidiscaviarum TaxID=1823 RepID=A0A378YAX4_9NOCA|nr:Uncharacterised protein [Nocardia otitidiscaviarum]
MSRKRKHRDKAKTLARMSGTKVLVVLRVRLSALLAAALLVQMLMY